jgi:hypothetical protein
MLHSGAGGDAMELTDFIRRYTSIASVIDSLRRRQLALLDPQTWDDRNDRYFMELYKKHRKVTGLYALCAAQSAETYHHWRVFGGGADGACLEIKRLPLEESLSSDPRVRVGTIEYKLIVQIGKLRKDDRDKLPFLKRKPYEPECEYRIIAETTDPQASALSIPIDITWINRVYLNPWLPQPLFESIKQTIREIPGCDGMKVVRTTMLDNSRWKAAGDRLAGVASTPPTLPLRTTTAKP